MGHDNWYTGCPGNRRGIWSVRLASYPWFIADDQWLGGPRLSDLWDMITGIQGVLVTEEVFGV